MSTVTKDEDSIVRYIKMIIPAIIVIVIGILIMKWFISMKKPTIKRNIPVITKSLSVSKVTFEDNISNLTILGKVESKNKINLASEVSGKVVWTSLNTGKSFKKGDVLAKIDSETQLNNLKIRTSELLLSVVNMLPDLKIDINEEYTKWENFANELTFENIPALPKYNSNKEKIFITQRAIFTQYYNLLNQKEMLSKYTIRAPFSCTVSSNNCTVGAMVSPGFNLATITNTTSYEVKLPVSQNIINKIIIGEVVNVSLNSMNYNTTGKIVRKTNVINSQNQTQYVIIELNEKNNSPILDGSYVNVDLSTEIENCFKIKRSALFKDQYLIAVTDIKDIVEKKMSGEYSDKKTGNTDKKQPKDKEVAPVPKKRAGTALLRKVNIVYTDNQYVYVSNGIEPNSIVVNEPTQDIDNNTLISPIFN